MNKVVLIGRLTADPNMRNAQTDSLAIATFTLAVDRRFKKEGQEADFIRCIGFGKTATFIGQYFKKGMKMALEGRWQTGSYTNDAGQKVYTNDCVIDSVEFVEPKKDGQTDGQTDGWTNASSEEWANIPDDLELPFE